LPAIVLTAPADVPLAVRAASRGAAEFVETPFDRDALLDRVRRAVRRDARRRELLGSLAALDRRFAALPERERAVLDGVKRGLSPRTIAERLGVTVRAVNQLRADLQTTLGADSPDDLLRLAWCVDTRSRPAAEPACEDGKSTVHAGEAPAK
jgi:two-component system response regulator FixJ